MDKRSEKILALAGGMAVVWLIADAALASRAHLHSLTALVPFTAWSAALCWFGWLRLRLARRAEEEQRDRELARATRQTETIFEEGPGTSEAFSIARSREQFEKWFVPAAALVVAGGLGAWAGSLWRDLPARVASASHHLMAASLLGGQAFLTFLLSRYLLGLGRVERLLRGPGVALGVTALASVLGAVAVVVARDAYPPADRLAARVLIVTLGVVAVEGVLQFLWELYRPRRGKELNYATESRLGGLLADPAAWAKNLAGALDYQFGFKVSETWLYRFLEGALLPVVLFQLVVLYLLSTLVFLDPAEAAILERFGQPARDLTSGFHFKWPWPFETVRRFEVRRVQSFEIGYQDAARGAPAADKSTLLWTVPHFQQEDQFLTASAETAAGDAVPVNLVSFNVRVEYFIADMRQYAYRHAAPGRVLEQAAYRVLTQTTAARGLFDVMGEGRREMAGLLQTRLQAEADRLGLGVRVAFVGVEGVHPPTQIADAFQSVIGSVEEREAAILGARADANRVLPLAEAEAAQVTSAAEAYAVQRTEIAAADSDRFLKRLESYRQAPSVFKTRLYLATFRDAVRDARKYIIAASPGSEVIQINLEEKLSPDLLDLGPTEKK